MSTTTTTPESKFDLSTPRGRSCETARRIMARLDGWQTTKTITILIKGRSIYPDAKYATVSVRSVLQALHSMDLIERRGKRLFTWRKTGKSYDQSSPLGKTIVNEKRTPTTRPDVEALIDRVNELSKQVIKLQNAAPVQVIVKTPAEKTVATTTLKEPRHPIFDQVLKLASAGKNILLVGPTGCGKTHLAEQVARALKRQFGFVSCSEGMPESEIKGRMILNEKAGMSYQVTQFYKCFKEGGVFLFDELDNSDANTLTILNSALANGTFATSNPKEAIVKKHKHFVCIAAANTWGRGSDRLYVGRNQLDEATLDRFRIGTLNMDYDRDLERKLCPDPALEQRLERYRQRIFENRLERVVSTRFKKDAYEAKQDGFDDDYVDSALFSGWSPDEVRRVKGGA